MIVWIALLEGLQKKRQDICPVANTGQERLIHSQSQCSSEGMAQWSAAVGLTQSPLINHGPINGTDASGKFATAGVLMELFAWIRGKSGFTDNLLELEKTMEFLLLEA